MAAKSFGPTRVPSTLAPNRRRAISLAGRSSRRGKVFRIGPGTRLRVMATGSNGSGSEAGVRSTTRGLRQTTTGVRLPLWRTSNVRCTVQGPEPISATGRLVRHRAG